MVTIRTLETILVLLIAYLIVATISGIFCSWIAQKVGDFSAKSEYPLTLNPLYYVDFIGLLFLIFFNFGWGRQIRVNIHFIAPPHRLLKIAAAWLAESIIDLGMAFVSMIILLKAFGVQIIELVIPMVVYDAISLRLLAEYYPESSSFGLVVGIILVAIIFLAVLLATFSFIAAGCRLVLLLCFGEQALYDDFLSIIFPLLLMFFLVYPLKVYFLLAIADSARLLALLIG